MSKALVFDFGNVLMHTIDYTPRHRWDELLQLPHGTVERAVHNTDTWLKFQQGHIAPSDYWADVAAKLNITTEQVQALAADFYAGDALDENLVEAIRAWRSKDIPVGLLSNDSVELRPRLMQLGIAGLFSPLVISAEVGAMKPAATAYRAVLAALPTYASADIIFVDDRAENIAGAQALGITAIHYPVGTPAATLIKQLSQIVDATS